MNAVCWCLDRARPILIGCLLACLPYALIRLGDWYACRFAIDTDGMGDSR